MDGFQEVLLGTFLTALPFLDINLGSIVGGGGVGIVTSLGENRADVEGDVQSGVPVTEGC